MASSNRYLTMSQPRYRSLARRKPVRWQELSSGASIAVFDESSIAVFDE
jgi:hypothetical protein